MKETVCVTGGSGGIGQAVLEQLVDLYHVRALFRTRTDITDKWEQRGCTPVWGDLEDEGALAELVKGATLVFHCAALVAASSYAQAEQVNVGGTRRLARLAAASGCRRLIHISSAAVYSCAAEGADYTEDTPLSEHADMAVYALTKLQAELALQEVSKQYGLEYTILRPTCVYGPNTKSWTLVPIDLIRKGLPVIAGDGHALLDAVYVDDVARAVLLAAQSPQAAGQVFNIGHETVTLNDFYSHFSATMNRPSRHLPLPLIVCIARLLDLLPGRFKANASQLRRGLRLLIQMSRNQKAWPSSKAARMLGYAPAVSLTVGMLRTAVWARQQGLIPESRFSLDFYGPLRFRPIAMTHPATEKDLVQILRTAQDAQVKVKAIGSLHSQCPIPETDGICVVLDRYNKLLRVHESTVTVQAGMTLRDLNDALAGHRLALPILGAIAAQTVSGAISTATHGGSMHYGSLSDCVEGLRMVRADGTIEEIDRSHHVFSAAAASLGLLGLISTVTFRCVPAFVLQSRASLKSAQEVIGEFEEFSKRSLYVDMLYFPIIDTIAILFIDDAEDAQIGSLRQMKSRAVRKPPPKLRQRLTISVLKGGAWLLTQRTSVQRYFAKLSARSSYQPQAGRSDLILAFGDSGESGRSPGIIGDMEVAIPYEHASRAISLLRTHFQTMKKYPLIPVHIRCSPRSDLWMSPAYHRDVCWLEFCSYPATDNLFRQIHDLLKPFGYRFHWGKETAADREYIRQQYEKWDDFARLRESWDPNGIFLNRYLESFFPAAADKVVAGGLAKSAETTPTGALRQPVAAP